MDCNVGKFEGIIRFTLGIIILCLGVLFASWWGMLAIYFLLTGVLRWCPVYALAKIDKCRIKEKENPLQD